LKIVDSGGGQSTTRMGPLHSVCLRAIIDSVDLP